MNNPKNPNYKILKSWIKELRILKLKNLKTCCYVIMLFQILQNQNLETLELKKEQNLGTNLGIKKQEF